VNPYQAPTPRNPADFRGDWRFSSKVFLGWVVGASLIAGVLSALHAGFALRAFEAQFRLAPIVSIDAVRESAPQISAAAAAVGGFVAMHHRFSRPGGGWTATLRCWPIFGAVAPATLVSALLMAACALVISALVFNVPLRVSWQGVRELLRGADVLVGLARAFGLALVMIAVVAAIAPLLARCRRRLLVKAIVVLIVARVTALVASLAVAVIADAT
jgi:hypothetical protein